MSGPPAISFPLPDSFLPCENTIVISKFQNKCRKSPGTHAFAKRVRELVPEYARNAGRREKATIVSKITQEFITQHPAKHNGGGGACCCCYSPFVKFDGKTYWQADVITVRDYVSSSFRRTNELSSKYRSSTLFKSEKRRILYNAKKISAARGGGEAPASSRPRDEIQETVQQAELPKIVDQRTRAARKEVVVDGFGLAADKQQHLIRARMTTTKKDKAPRVKVHCGVVDGDGASSATAAHAQHQKNMTLLTTISDTTLYYPPVSQSFIGRATSIRARTVSSSIIPHIHTPVDFEAAQSILQMKESSFF